MDQLPRQLFYISGLLLLSAAFIVFTTDLLNKVNDGTTAGTIIFFMYGIVYLYMVAMSSKRYMRRLQGPSKVPYLFAAVIFLPPTIWVFFYKGGEATSPVVFTIMLLLVCGLGARFGNQLGLKAQIKFQNDLKAYFEREGRLTHRNDDLS